MEVLDFDDWPAKRRHRETHPVLLDAIAKLKTGSHVLLFTEKDLEDLPNKSLQLLEQRLRNLAQAEGFRITSLQRDEDEGGPKRMYVRRNNAKRK